MESQRINNETKETNERLNKAREAYKWLKNNVFGKNMGTKGFPLGNDWDHGRNKVDDGRLKRYISKFRDKNFCIDENSSINLGEGKIKLIFDDMYGNEDYNKWQNNKELIVETSKFVDKENGKYVINEKKFRNIIKNIVKNICNDKEKWPDL